MNIYHIDFYEGSRFQTTFEITSDGDPVDLTDYSAKLEVFSGSRVEPILTATTANDRLSIVAVEGKILIDIPHDVTIPSGVIDKALYRYALYLIDPDDKQTLEFSGDFRFNLFGK